MGATMKRKSLFIQRTKKRHFPQQKEESMELQSCLLALQK